MRKSVLLSSVFVFALLLVGINATEYIAKEEEAVKEVILNGYAHGAFNELNPEAMAETFHKDFAIFSVNGEEIGRYPISKWIESTKKRKESTEFDPENNVWEPEFTNISVTGNAASVELELHHKGKHVFTDYLSLLKFESGWKVVAKVYHRHQ
ncbi:nuclear transport factor 2 family protein [Gracilimonas sediminicola]|uniref:Nuclear transport factor 2 family protein n=1 Tax=Gracilimonas sediminicola TaxID=2952158 RepID=A0A9X2L4B8_9BACT|nr:nuclear transport factor 2 family protein [Gracilimonas sediminicola]MCP9292025.1 nuclear transport factor 2 family protein [Gracilimonas sediminicola]